jgi:hypothetical protein
MRFGLGAAIGALAALGLAGPALADGFLIIAGVTVPVAADPGNPGWMDVTSYQLNGNGVSFAVFGAQMSWVTGSVTISRNSDQATPLIVQAAGKKLPFAILDVPAPTARSSSTSCPARW